MKYLETMADGSYLLQRYYILINSHTKPLKCQFCFKKFLAEDLENHFFSEHRYRYPSQNACPWCAGNRSWKPRQKSRHARHLLNCFKRYKNRYEWVDSSKICESREFYGRPKLCEMHPYAYESVFLPPLRGGWWNLKEEQQQQPPLCLENEDLGIHYVREFIHFDGSPVCWFHLAVRAYALSAFFETFGKFWERDRAFLLEFSCWCDGGEPYEDSFLLHHRHMIVMVRNRKDFYENFWKKFEINQQDGSSCGGRYKMCRVIRSWIQLKNTIFCLSSRKANCEFFDEDDMVRSSHQRRPNLCHFYIFRPLSPDFKWRVPLKLASKEGMAETITSLMRETPVTEFASKCSLGSCRRWRVKFGDVIGIINNNFLSIPESMKNDWWYPPRKQQEILDQVVPLMKKIEWLNMENEGQCGSEKRMERSEVEMKKQLEELKVGLNEIRQQISSSTEKKEIVSEKEMTTT